MTPGDAARIIERMVQDRPERVAKILATNGAKIEQQAAILTPVDTGMLMRATEYRVAGFDMFGHREVAMHIENRMIYAHYQHEHVLHHTKATARDKFIEIPFEKQLPTIVDEIVRADLQEAQE